MAETSAGAGAPESPAAPAAAAAAAAGEEEEQYGSARAAAVFSVDLSAIARCVGLSPAELSELQQKDGAAVGRFQAAVLRGEDGDGAEAEDPEAVEAGEGRVEGRGNRRGRRRVGSATAEEGMATNAGAASATPSSTDELLGWRLQTPLVSTAVITTTARPARKEEKSMPRELVLVDGSGGRCVLELLLQSLSHAGVQRVLLLLGRFGDKIERVIRRRRGISTNMTVECVQLGSNYNGGFARSLVRARRFVGHDLFLLLYSTHVFDPRLVHMLADRLPETMRGHGGNNEAVALIDTSINSANMSEAERADVPKTVGKVVHDEHTHRITSISRGLRSFNAIDAGLFLLSPGVLEYILDFAASESHFSFADVLNRVAKDRGLAGVPTGGLRWMTVEPGRRDPAPPSVAAASTTQAAGLARTHGQSLMDPWWILENAGASLPTDDDDDDTGAEQAAGRALFVMGMESGGVPTNSHSSGTATAGGVRQAHVAAGAGTTNVQGGRGFFEARSSTSAAANSNGAGTASLFSFPSRAPTPGISVADAAAAATVTAAGGHGGVLVPVQWRAPTHSKRHMRRSRSARQLNARRSGKRRRGTSAKRPASGTHSERKQQARPRDDSDGVVFAGGDLASSSSSGADSEDNSTRRHQHRFTDVARKRYEARYRTISTGLARKAKWAPTPTEASDPKTQDTTNTQPGNDDKESDLSPPQNRALDPDAEYAGPPLHDHVQHEASDSMGRGRLLPMPAASAITMNLEAGESVHMSENEALLVLVPRAPQPVRRSTSAGPPAGMTTSDAPGRQLGTAGARSAAPGSRTSLRPLREVTPLTAVDRDPSTYGSSAGVGEHHTAAEDGGLLSRQGKSVPGTEEPGTALARRGSFVERAAHWLTGNPDLPIGTGTEFASVPGTGVSGDDTYVSDEAQAGESDESVISDSELLDLSGLPVSAHHRAMVPYMSESEGGGRHAVSDHEHGRLTHPLRRKLVAKSSRAMCEQVAREHQLLMALPVRRTSFGHARESGMRGRILTYLPTLPSLPTDVSAVALEAALEPSEPELPPRPDQPPASPELEPRMRVIVTRRVPFVGWLIMIGAVLSVSSVGPIMALQRGPPPALQSAWRQMCAGILFVCLSLYESFTTTDTEGNDGNDDDNDTADPNKRDSSATKSAVMMTSPLRRGDRRGRSPRVGNGQYQQLANVDEGDDGEEDDGGRQSRPPQVSDTPSSEHGRSASPGTLSTQSDEGSIVFTDRPSWWTSVGSFLVLAAVVFLCGIGSFIAADSYTLALRMTSIAHASLFTNLTPIFVLLSRMAVAGIAGGQRPAEHSTSKESVSPIFQPVSYLEVIGAGLGILGAALTTRDRQRSTGSTLLGDLVALGGSVGGLIYLTGSKYCRSRLSLFLFMVWLEVVMCSLSVTVCTLTIPDFEIFSRDRSSGLFGWANMSSMREFPLQVLITLVADFGGICGYIASLKYVGPLMISMAGLMEPFIAIGETQVLAEDPLPGMWTWVGGSITVLGVALVILQSALPRKQVYDASDAIGQGTTTANNGSGGANTEDPTHRVDEDESKVQEVREEKDVRSRAPTAPSDAIGSVN